MAAALMGDEKASPARRNFVQGIFGSTGLGTTGLGVLDATPAGGVFGAQEAAREGDYKGAAMAMFLGPSARTADQVALAAAKSMAAKGAERAAILKETGWFTGADGKWRFEIPDHNSKITDTVFDDISATGAHRGNYPSALEHPDLYQAYPEFADVSMTMHAKREPGGNFHNGTNSVQVFGPSTGAQRSVALHEGQHVIQGIEGFERGGTPEGLYVDAPDKFSRAKELATSRNVDWGNLSGQDRQKIAMEVMMDDYRRLAGEVEARNVQSRRQMTPEQRRAIPPWETQDVPYEQQIVRKPTQQPQATGLLGVPPNM